MGLPTPEQLPPPPRPRWGGAAGGWAGWEGAARPPRLVSAMRKFSAAAGFLSPAELLKQEVGQGAGGSSGAAERGQTDGGSSSQCRGLGDPQWRVGPAVAAGPAPGSPCPPWSPAGTTATSPAPRPRSCCPGRARTGASLCAPASPSPGPTRCVCCKCGARPGRGGEAGWGLAPTRGQIVFMARDACTCLACCPDLLVGPAKAHCGPCWALELRFFCPRGSLGPPGTWSPLPAIQGRWCQGPGRGSPGSGRQAEAQGSKAGACVGKRLGQLRCWSKMPSLETLVEEQMWQERTFLEPRLWVPGGSCCSGNQNMGWVHSRKSSQFTQKLRLGP